MLVSDPPRCHGRRWLRRLLLVVVLAVLSILALPLLPPLRHDLLVRALYLFLHTVLLADTLLLFRVGINNARPDQLLPSGQLILLAPMY